MQSVDSVVVGLVRGIGQAGGGPLANRSVPPYAPRKTPYDQVIEFESASVARIKIRLSCARIVS